jgi:RNA polymerase sigma-70 factor, ECF subfamily
MKSPQQQQVGVPVTAARGNDPPQPREGRYIAIVPQLAQAVDLEAERPYLLARARRMSDNAHDAHDLVQDAFVRALPALGQVTAGAHLRAWMLTILRRLHIDRVRRRAREPALQSIDELRGQDLMGQHPLVESAQPASLADLHELLGELSEVFRQVFVMHELQGRSYREVSKTLEIPLATVGTRLRRARNKLKDSLLARRQTCLNDEPSHPGK